jgi:catechol 2,3-dioxygenase-like lactoylglutathione lyase family enzyme
VLRDSPLVAFVATTELERARTFYESVLGLDVVHADGFACVVDAHGTTLRVTAVPERAPAAYTVLGWEVADLEGEVDALVARGVGFSRFEGMDQDGRGIWTAPGGDRVAWFRDTEGNLLSLSQHV